MEAVAINTSVFLLKTKWQGLFLLDKVWNNAEFQLIQDEDVPRMITFFNDIGKKTDQKEEEPPITKVQRTGLARIRTETPGDFWLKGDDGESTEVHSIVLKPLWPFFAAAIDSRMIEAEENSIDLPFPTPTIDVAARYLYRQSLEMDFDEAAHLLVMAQMYDLPELLSLAVERAKKEPLDAQKAILLWQKVFEARNEDMRGYSLVEIKQMKLEISDSKLLEGLSREELLSLFVEVFSVKG